MPGAVIGGPKAGAARNGLYRSGGQKPVPRTIGTVRRFLPHLIELICSHEIDPGRVFDLTLPLDQIAEGYKAMDDRRAIKTLLTL